MGEKLVINPAFEICCPKCKDINTIQVQEDIKCKTCQTSFARKKFFGKISCSTISKLLLGASLGVGGTIYTENQKIEQKIPIPVEKVYKLAQSCIKDNSINNDYYTKKIRDNCFCAVERISTKYDLNGRIDINSTEMAIYYEKCSNQ